MKKTLLVLAALAMSLPLTAQAERSGEEVYKTKCQVCHAQGIAGSPKFGDKAAWASRIATGADAMLAVAKSGKGAMPPKGTCMDCSDAELTAAISYMVEHAK